MTYVAMMLTVVGTPTLASDARELWSEEDRGAFFAWSAANPEAGDVNPGSGGCRKVRWARAGTAKRSGVRVIYFSRLANGEIWLLVIYAKNVRGNIPSHILQAVREAIENDHEHVWKIRNHDRWGAWLEISAVRPRDEGR